MMSIAMTRLSVFLIVAFAWTTLVGVAAAQRFDQRSKGSTPDNESPLKLPGLLGLPGGATSDASDPITLSAKFVLTQGSFSGRLYVRAELMPGWHVYSLTQKKGGPILSEIEVVPSKDFKLTGKFSPDRDPRIVPPGGKNPFPVPSEEHEDEVTWSAPLQITPGVDPTQLPIELQFSGQVCHDEGKCLPHKQSLIVTFDGYEASKPTGVMEYRAKRTHAVIKGSITPKAVPPGGTFQLKLTAIPDKKYHIYAYASVDPMKVSKPTLIGFTKTAPLQVGEPIASELPIKKAVSGIPEEPVQFYHESPVTWTIDVKVPSNVSPGAYDISGEIGYQTCLAGGCDSPTGAAFSVTCNVDDNPVPGEIAVGFSPSSYDHVSKLAANRPLPISLAGSGGDTNSLKDSSLPAILGLAFLAGLILNIMPCVLPVIGLKLMSFVQQASESRIRIFMLNVWFSLGLLSVFWAFASVAAIFSLLGRGTFGWAEQFQHAAFNIGMSSIVFVFALSFLGVWEVPIPGFVGTGAASQYATREGPFGAFCKGILATLLATPCTGPLMGPAVSWAVVQPPAFTYLVFTSLGLGMASPFLLIGAFPYLMRLIPKPGPWMETFKQFMGFVLLGTVVWMFFSLEKIYIIRAMVFFIGLGMACWIVGRIDFTADFSAKIRGWATAIACGAAFWFVAFGPLTSGEANPKSQLAWIPYERAVLEDHLRSGRAVLVDFTADWCATCKVNEAIALNTVDTKKIIEENRVVAIKADKTRASPEIDQLLKELGNQAALIPFYAIFPPDGGKPITLDGIITKGLIIEKLREVGKANQLRTMAME